MIGPTEIDEMLAEYADAIAGSEPAATDPIPVWRATDEPVATTAPYQNVGLVPVSFLFLPIRMARPAS